MHYGIYNGIERMDQLHTMEYTMQLGEWTENILLNLQWNWENGPRTYYGIYKGIGRMDQLRTMESTRELGEWTKYALWNLQWN